MNYSEGWRKAIAEANARVIGGIVVDLKSDTRKPPAKQEVATGMPEPLPTEADYRDAAIKDFCGKIGVPMGIARKYRFDIRPLHSDRE